MSGYAWFSRIFQKTQKQGIYFSAGCACGGRNTGIHAILYDYISIRQAGQKELPIYCVGTEEKKIALSFDAAWGNEDTQTLLDILAAYDVHVTFL